MKNWQWFLLGVAALLLLKYVVIGLDRWNAAFHPGRVEGPEVQKFRKGLIP